MCSVDGPTSTAFRVDSRLSPIASLIPRRALSDSSLSRVLRERSTVYFNPSLSESVCLFVSDSLHSVSPVPS